jgi:hypothetical protein
VQYHICSEASAPRASKEQVEAAAAFINKMKLDSWSVFDISDPGDLLGCSDFVHYAGSHFQYNSFSGEWCV